MIPVSLAAIPDIPARRGVAMPTAMLPACERATDARFEISGPLGAYLRGVSDQWLRIAPDANPAMLEMFRDRDRLPYRNMVPWAGEFAGKYLTGATQTLRVTGDPALRRYLAAFVEELLTLQDEDGYLGPWPAFARLRNRVEYPDGHTSRTWDTWGHYHAMLGLLLWHEESGDARALAAARRIGDLLCDTFLGASPRLADTGCVEMNLAPAHSLCLLYRATGEARYLQLARQLADDEFGAVTPAGTWLGGNWLQGPLDGQEFFELPLPRWEALHPIMALPELYYLTGESRYREAFARLWESIVELDRHNNGGFSSGEQAQGNPYHQGAIETCCTIAWTAMSVEMLRMTKDPRVADELEMTLWNSIVGMHTWTGRWATYNTPMDGVRRASAHEIVFQSREGTPELNCCSVNSARGFGMLSDWALMRDADGLLLNWYGSGTLATDDVTLVLETAYPVDGAVRIRVAASQPGTLVLKLRIPRWSARTEVRVNGTAIDGVQAGSYLCLNRAWAVGDVIDLVFDMALHAWVGAKEVVGLTSLYRGPLLLTYDRRFNAMSPDAVPIIDATGPAPEVASWAGRMPPMLLLAVPCDGQTLYLCDFGSAGEGGTPYRSWLPVAHADALPQYFASDPSMLLNADLRILAKTFVDPEAEEALLLASSPEPPLKRLARAIDCADRLVVEREAARAALAAMLETPGADRLRATLQRLGDHDTATYRARLIAMSERWLSEHPDSPVVISAYTATPLLGQPVPIAEVPLPPEESVFSPAPFVWETELADIRSFHLGRDGLLYLRASVVLPAEGQGRLLFGADGPVKVWVNGVAVACVPDARVPAAIGEYAADLTWQAGVNTVTFALSTDHGHAWGVVARAVWRA
jgi:DUF1680 family protein